MTENEIKAIKELQDEYEYNYIHCRYERCKGIMDALLILNKHLNGISDWRIQFEGSKADELVNVRAEEAEAYAKDIEQLNRAYGSAYKKKGVFFSV